MAETENETLSLAQATTHLLEECRMVLPGIQALFGFQLIAVLQPTFAEKLSPGEQRLHLAAILLAIVSAALVIAPAAIHRMNTPRRVSELFLVVTSRLIGGSMATLALALALETHLITELVVGDDVVAGVVAAGVVAVFVGCWVVLPRAMRRRSPS